MASKTTAVTQDTATVGQALGVDERVSRPSRRQRIARRIALALAIISAIFLLYPVIASPITGDDRYWYLWSTVSSDGSFVELLQYSWERLFWRIDHGRVNLLTEIQRRFASLAIMKAAVATSVPIPVYQALLKLGLFGGGILTVLAFIRSLRWRAADGTLVRVSRRSLVLVGMAGTIAVAAGVQATRPMRNGWTAYPINTYGAVIFIFGSIALLLWLTRLVAERSRAMVITAVVVSALLAIAANLSYELVLPAVPVAALALVVVPVTDRARRAAGRRAKLVTGLAYFGTFIPIFVALRLYLASECADGGCFSAVKMELGMEAVRTTAYSFTAAVPGSSDSELRDDLAAIGWADRFPILPAWWSVLVGLVAVSALLIVWWATRRDRPSSVGQGGVSMSSLGHQRAEAHLLVVGAVLALLVAIGVAVVMGIGSVAQDRLTAFGEPYRNIVVTWTGLAFCLVLVIVALGLAWRPRSAVVAWTALAIAIGTVAASTLPANLMALRATRITHAVTDDINWEVVKGDTSPSGDSRRCELYAAIDHIQAYTRKPFREYTNPAFEMYHGEPFCAENAPSGDPE